MQRYLQAFDTLLGREPSSDVQGGDFQLFSKSRDSELIDELLRVHEYERQRLGQELHDTAGQLVVALQFSVANLRRADADSGHDGLFQDIQDTVRRIDQELRSLAFLHYPAELGDRSLGAALNALVTGFGRRTGTHATFKSSGETADADHSVSIAILRIAQEALVNVHRHSKATAVRVHLERRKDELRLTVSDNGIGLRGTEKSPGIGLQGMRHRVESLGGRFKVTNLGHGAKASASVPVAATCAHSIRSAIS